MNIEEIIGKLNYVNILWQIVTPLIFSLADIISGYIQAVINKNVDSAKMRVGLLHKVLMFLVILLSYVIQIAFSIKFIASVVSIYVVLMEIISILENLKKAGVDIGNLKEILKSKEDK